MPEKQPYKPLSKEEYQRRLAALPPELQRDHLNEIELMEAAATGDREKVRAVLRKRVAERHARGDFDD